MDTRKRVAIWGIGLSALLLLVDFQIGTNSGNVSIRFLAPFIAAHFALRYYALRIWGVRRGTLGPRLGVRAASWALIAIPFWMAGVFQYSPFGIPFLVILGVDHLMCALAKDPEPEAEEAAAPGRGMHAALRAVFLILALAGAGLFHFLVAAPLSWGRLLEWGVASLVLCIVLWRMLASGPKAPDRLPQRYSIHAPRARPIHDPLTAPFERAVEEFMRDGDSEGLVRAAEAVCTTAGLPPPVLDAVRRDMRAALIRSGTRRQDDLRDAVAVLARALDAPVPVPIARGPGPAAAPSPAKPRSR